MEPDYPAAHSMDTTWFAVDADGAVAMFDTGENGHCPEIGRNDVSGRLDQLLPLQAEDDEDWKSTEDLCRDLGIYFYNFGLYDGWGLVDPIDLYGRGEAPAHPLHLDELPPEMRDSVRLIRFAQLRFSETKQFQPLDYHPCSYWYTRSAYVTSDGKVVRPIPGQEAKFADFVAELRRLYPELANRFVFEGPGVEPHPG